MSTTNWSYDASLISTSTAVANTMIVRRMIGDVLIGDQQLQDVEINYAISQWSNLYLASAECCRWIAAQYSRKVDLVQGDLKTNYSNQQKSYAMRAAELETIGKTRGAGSMPFAGGIDVDQKQASEEDPNRVTPQFNIGMADNLLPIGVGSGNETPGNPDGGGTGGDQP